MSARRPWALSVGRRPILPLLLALVAGGATAGFGAYYVGAAWSGFVHCPSGGGSGCAPHPFWGLPPELYLIACLLGIGAGILTAVLGGLLFLGWMESRRVAYGIVALSAIGVIAYGGLGVGTVAGVVAGWLVLRARGARSPAPSEWSGSLPTGVPPVLRGSKRSLTDRPPVTEWSGIFAAAPSSPPGRGRNRVSLPTADRLALALAKGRAAGLRQGAAVAYPPAVVVLPPPPIGLRGLARPSTVGVGTARGVPVATAGLTVPAPPSSLSSTETVALRPVSPSPLVRRWKAETAEITPWASPKADAVPSPAAAARAGEPSPAPSPVPSVEGIPALGDVTTGMPPPILPSSAPVAPGTAEGPPSLPLPAAAPATSAPTAAAPTPGAGPSYRTGPLRSPFTRSPTPSTPSEPSSFTPTYAPATGVAPGGPSAPAPPLAVSRPAPPTVPLAKGRTRAWRCPNCQLINAPWSPRCTKCKTEAPAS
jgi:hypothetical protein